jgi:hypothetical protein
VTSVASARRSLGPPALDPLAVDAGRKQLFV